jgi:hypothetical protein
MLDFVICPEPTCEAIAEIVDSVAVGSTAGPVEIVRTQCLHRHIFMLPGDLVRPAVTGAHPSMHSAVD